MNPDIIRNKIDTTKEDLESITHSRLETIFSILHELDREDILDLTELMITALRDSVQDIHGFGFDVSKFAYVASNIEQIAMCYNPINPKTAKTLRNIAKML